ncbi:MAG TPA: hypothetical protein VFY26_01085 [Anaerolineales bacterium]|nr:hypothetical protein [Anaerolineales bacterium]
MSKTIKPEKQKTEHLQTQRWENEGGNSVESEPTRIAAGRFVKPVPTTEGIQDLPRKWSSTFVIEPIQAGAGFGLMEENAEGKKDQNRRLQ